MRKPLLKKISVGLITFTLAYLASLLVIDTKILEFRWDLLFMFWAGMFYTILTNE